MKLTIYYLAIATFAPSDLSGVGGMHHECICALPLWKNGPSHCDTVLVSTSSQLNSMLGLDVGHVCLFFSFTYEDVEYPCALINWYDCVSDLPDKDTGMWIINPIPESSVVVYIDTIL